MGAIPTTVVHSRHCLLVVGRAEDSIPPQQILSHLSAALMIVSRNGADKGNREQAASAEAAAGDFCYFRVTPS